MMKPHREVPRLVFTIPIIKTILDPKCTTRGPRHVNSFKDESECPWNNLCRILRDFPFEKGDLRGEECIEPSYQG